MTIKNADGAPLEWVLQSCDQCGAAIERAAESEQRPAGHMSQEASFPQDWCVIVLTRHPAMGPGARLRFAVLCPECNPYRLGPDGAPMN